MDESQYSFVTVVIERSEALARKALGERIARHTAELAKRGGLATNRRWFAEIDIYEEEARGFLLACCAEIGQTIQGAEAFALIAERFEVFRFDAKQQFTQRFEAATRFTNPASAITALPNAQRHADAGLDLELKLQRQAFLNRQATIPSQPTSKPIVPARNKGGKPLAPHWDSLWAAIAVQLWTGKLNPKRQSDITTAMKAWLDSENLESGETAIVERARRLWQEIERSGEAG